MRSLSVSDDLLLQSPTAKDHLPNVDITTPVTRAEQPPRASPVATKLRHKLLDLHQQLSAAERRQIPLIPDMKIVNEIAHLKTELILTDKALQTNLASTKRSRLNRSRKRTADMMDGKLPPKLGRPTVKSR